MKKKMKWLLGYKRGEKYPHKTTLSRQELSQGMLKLLYNTCLCNYGRLPLTKVHFYVLLHVNINGKFAAINTLIESMLPMSLGSIPTTIFQKWHHSESITSSVSHVTCRQLLAVNSSWFHLRLFTYRDWKLTMFWAEMKTLICNEMKSPTKDFNLFLKADTGLSKMLHMVDVYMV